MVNNLLTGLPVTGVVDSLQRRIDKKSITELEEILVPETLDARFIELSELKRRVELGERLQHQDTWLLTILYVFVGYKRLSARCFTQRHLQTSLFNQRKTGTLHARRLTRASPSIH